MSGAGISGKGFSLRDTAGYSFRKGSGGGSASLYDVPWGDPIDLTDGWTLTDPDGLIQSASFDAVSGYNTVVWNDLLVASSDYNWSAGANHRAPRWSKPAEIDGNALTADDLINAIFYAQADNSVRDFDNAWLNGICVDPTSTAVADIAGMGLYANAVRTAATTALGVWTVNGSLTSTASTNTRCQTCVQYGGQHTGSGVFDVLDAGGFRVRSGSRNGNFPLPPGSALHWIVGVGTRSNTTTVPGGSQQRFKLYQRSIKLDLAAIL
jgi:hypothetical protein